MQFLVFRYALDELDQQFIYDYSIGTTIFESSSGTELEQNNVIFSVFERINTGAEKLSDQEIRNAVYGGELLIALKELLSNPDYLELIGKDKTLLRRGKNIELLLRFITYKHIYDNTQKGIMFLVEGDDKSKITTSKKLMLNNYMYFANKNDIDYKTTLNEVLEAITVISSFDNTAFYGKAREGDQIGTKVHELFAEALVIAVIKNNYQISVSKEEFIKRKITLWNNESSMEPFKYKTTDYTTIEKRVHYLSEMLRG